MLVALLLAFSLLYCCTLLLFQVRHTNIMINYICLFIIYNSSDFLLCVCVAASFVRRRVLLNHN